MFTDWFEATAGVLLAAHRLKAASLAIVWKDGRKY